MPTLGQELRKKREEHGSSLKEISVRTKIGSRLLQALEDDRLDLLPEPFFLKGILRSYVQTIGADEQYFLGRLAEQTNAPVLPKAEHSFEAAGWRRRPGLRLAALVLVLAAAGAAGYLILRARPAPHRVVQSRATDVPAGKPQESLPAAVPAQSPDARLYPLKLEMSFTADTWMIVNADGAKVYEGVRTAGETAAYTAEKELLLQIGNAGGFAFKLNGKPGKPLGPSGSVRTNIRITPATVADFLDGTASSPAVR